MLKTLTKLFLKKSEGKIVTIQIISSISKDKYIDTVENFDKLLNYLLKNVEKRKNGMLHIRYKKKRLKYDIVE